MAFLDAFKEQPAIAWTIVMMIVLSLVGTVLTLTAASHSEKPATQLQSAAESALNSQARREQAVGSMFSFVGTMAALVLGIFFLNKK
jgi:hypothetical protein